MIQNHLLQVLAFVAMEPPDSLAPGDVRDREAELLEAVRPFSEDELVRGQYAAGGALRATAPAAVEDFLARVREVTGGKGVDVVLDGIGGKVSLRSFRALRVGDQITRSTRSSRSACR